MTSLTNVALTNEFPNGCNMKWNTGNWNIDIFLVHSALNEIFLLIFSIYISIVSNNKQVGYVGLFLSLFLCCFFFKLSRFFTVVKHMNKHSVHSTCCKIQ